MVKQFSENLYTSFVCMMVQTSANVRFIYLFPPRISVTWDKHIPAFIGTLFFFDADINHAI